MKYITARDTRRTMLPKINGIAYIPEIKINKTIDLKNKINKRLISHPYIQGF